MEPATEPDQSFRPKKAGRAASERTCLVTRLTGSPETMLRFVLDPQHNVIFDRKANLPGRGVWVTATHTHVSQAVRKNAFAKGFKRQVQVRPDLADHVLVRLQQRLTQTLSLANKAGALVWGEMRVREALTRGGVVLLLHAQGASEKSMKALSSMKKTDMETIIGFNEEDLEKALGRGDIMHAVCLGGEGSQGVVEAWHRIRCYREG